MSREQHTYYTYKLIIIIDTHLVEKKKQWEYLHRNLIRRQTPLQPLVSLNKMQSTSLLNKVGSRGQTQIAWFCPSAEKNSLQLYSAIECAHPDFPIINRQIAYPLALIEDKTKHCEAVLPPLVDSPHCPVHKYQRTQEKRYPIRLARRIWTPQLTAKLLRLDHR